MNLTPEHLHILQHSLGCDEYGRSQTPRRDEGDGCHGFFRNRFVCVPSEGDGLICDQLVAAGFMHDGGAQPLYGGMHYYSVTRAGVRAMLLQSPRPPKLSQSKKRYRQFLDEDSDLSFGEWLKLKRPIP